MTGHHFHDLINTHSQQDVDLDKLFMDVTIYNTRVMGPAHGETVTDLACRNALSKRGVAHINGRGSLGTMDEAVVEWALPINHNVLPFHSTTYCSEQRGFSGQ